MANNPSAERILFSSDSNVQYLKATEQIELVGQMDNIRQRAQEVALSEQIYCWGVAMFGWKKRDRVLVLCAGECRLLTTAMLSFRNKLVACGTPTEDVSELLIQLIR